MNFEDIGLGASGLCHQLEDEIGSNCVQGLSIERGELIRTAT